jgi:hypothetical protein
LKRETAIRNAIRVGGMLLPYTGFRTFPSDFLSSAARVDDVDMEFEYELNIATNEEAK